MYGSAGLIKKIIKKKNELFIKGQKYENNYSFFPFLIQSYNVAILKVSNSLELQTFPLSFVKGKTNKLPIQNNEYVVSALL